jgi:hypothetical protein
MDQAIKAGISGFVIAVIISVISPVDLDFMPELLASVIAIYIFGLKTFKDGLLVALITYLFSLGVLGSITLAIYFIPNEPFNLTLNAWMVLDQIVTPLSALFAAFIGVWLAKSRRLPEAQPRPPAPIPPV